MIRFGIVGTGRISDWVLKGAVLDQRFKATAVCSRNEHTAIAFIKNHPEVFDKDTRIFTSIEELASSPAVDAVYIGTPNTTHHQYTLTCLNAGKHVLCEKPLACNAQEVQEMIEASRRNGKALMEAMISTLNPNFLEARKLIHTIEPVRQVFSSYCQYSTKYDDLKNGIVANSFNPNMGGGALEDVGIYTTYPLVALFGEPSKVNARLSYIKTAEGTVETQGCVDLQYEGMIASLSYSKSVDAHIPTEYCGEGGNIILDEIHSCKKAVIIPHSTPNSGRGPKTEPEIIGECLQKDDYFYEFEEFISIIESGRIESEINSHKVSLSNRKLMDKIKKSI